MPSSFQRKLEPKLLYLFREQEAKSRWIPAFAGMTISCPPLNQIRLNTSVPLVPPKPKPFDTATSIFFSRAVCGT